MRLFSLTFETKTSVKCKNRTLVIYNGLVTMLIGSNKLSYRLYNRQVIRRKVGVAYPMQREDNFRTIIQVLHLPLKLPLKQIVSVNKYTYI